MRVLHDHYFEGCAMMFCPKCGTENDEDAKWCKKCGNQISTQSEEKNVKYCAVCGTAAHYTSDKCKSCGQVFKQGSRQSMPDRIDRTEISNYLAQAILVFLFCFWVTGIVAIVYAAQVNGKIGMRDYEGAKRASDNAKVWSWISFGIGLAIWLPLILGFMVCGVAFL